MNKKERVLNALTLKEVDRPPVSFWHHFAGEDAVGRGCVDAHMRYYKATDVDYIKIMSDKIAYELGETITKASDWRKVKPQGKKSAFIADSLDRAKMLNDALQGDCLTFYNIFAPFSVIRFATSDDMVMAHLKEDEEAVLSAAAAAAEDAAELSRLLIEEGGCAGIYLALQAAEKWRFQVEEYAKFVCPSDLIVLNEANKYSETNIAHLCGWAGDPNNLEDWYDYPARAVNWATCIENVSLPEGRDLFPGKAIIGGFDNRKDSLIVNGSKEEIQAFAKNLVASFGKTGLLIGADCTLPATIDTQHIAWVVEAINEL
jgi:uroporphyrinogen decarboxylase